MSGIPLYIAEYTSIYILYSLFIAEYTSIYMLYSLFQKEEILQSREEIIKPNIQTECHIQTKSPEHVNGWYLRL